MDSGCSTHLCKEEEKFTRKSDMTNGKVNLANLDSSTEAKAKVMSPSQLKLKGS